MARLPACQLMQQGACLPAEATAHAVALRRRCSPLAAAVRAEAKAWVKGLGEQVLMADAPEPGVLRQQVSQAREALYCLLARSRLASTQIHSCHPQAWPHPTLPLCLHLCSTGH